MRGRVVHNLGVVNYRGLPFGKAAEGCRAVPAVANIETMTNTGKSWLLVAGLLSVANCAPTLEWAKAGVSQRIAGEDYGECRRTAERVAEDRFRHEREILRVRAVTDRRDDRTGSAQIDLQRLDAERDFERVRLLRRCMEDRGYSLVPIRAPA